MVTNRTKTDVENAIKIRSQKIQHQIPLTDEEIDVMERGMLTINTINRIEENEEEIETKINGIGYYNTNLITKRWSFFDIFDSDNFDRILKNAQKLKDAFFTYYSTPQIPSPVFYSIHFNTINDLEKILVDLHMKFDEVVALYSECGATECEE